MSFFYLKVLNSYFIQSKLYSNFSEASFFCSVSLHKVSYPVVMPLRQKNYSQIMHKMGDAPRSLHIEAQRWCSFGLQFRIIDMNKTMTLGDKILKLRKDNNYTQEQLAGILGVSRQSVSKWESNLAYPETDKLLRPRNPDGGSD